MNLWRTLMASAAVLVAWAGPGWAADPPRLRVVTTILPVYCWAKNVAGDAAEVSNLLEKGVGPHDFQFTPRDRSRLGQADVVIVNGLGLESWMDRALKEPSTSLRPRVVVQAVAGLKAELIHEVTGLKIEGAAPADRAEHDHGAGQANPHIWLDPRLAAHAVTNILRALQQADPSRAAQFEVNARAYLGRLQALDRELETALTPLRAKPFIAYHDAFPYFTRRYQLNMVGVIEEVPDVEPNFKYISSLKSVIRTRQVGVIFTEPQFPARLARRIADDTGVALAELDPLETGPLVPDAYENGLRAIMQTLVRTLH